MTTYFSDFSPVSRIDSGLLYFLKSCKCGKHLLRSGSVKVNCYFIITSAFNDCSYRPFSEFDMSDTVSHSVRKLPPFGVPNCCTGFGAVNAFVLNVSFACMKEVFTLTCSLSSFFSFFADGPVSRSSNGISFKKRDIFLYCVSPCTIRFLAQVSVRSFSALVIPT